MTLNLRQSEAAHQSLQLLLALISASAAMVATVRASDVPSADYIFPAGGQQGTTVEFRVGAHFLHGGAPFAMDGPGISAAPRVTRTETLWFEGPMILKPASQGGENYPKDHLGKVQIHADAAPGVRYWRLWTSQGVVNSKPFVIGTLPEVVEEEIDGRPLPVQVELPVTINGRMFPREDVDIWEFQAQAGESISCEVQAARIGSPLDSHLEVIGPSGNTIVENSDHFGADSFLRFQAPTTGVYRVRIYDSTYRGLQQFVYRLTITNAVRIDRVFPAGGKAGETVRVRAFGQDVPDETLEVALPGSTGESLVSLPVALGNTVLMDVSDVPEHVESPETSAVPVAMPCALNGVIEEPQEVDRWIVSARAEQRFSFDLATARYGSDLDPVLTVFDSAGKQLAQFASTEGSPLEPNGVVTFPADGDYRIEVSDYRPQVGGPSHSYRLKITDVPQPDFELSLPSDALTLFRGAEAKLKVKIARQNGFQEAVELSVAELPDDVTVSNTTIAADKKEAELVFKAQPSARVRLLKLSVGGKAAESQLTRKAMLPSLRGAPDRQQLFLAVSMPTPFKLDGEAFRTEYAARGTVHRRHYLIHRGDYEGPLTLGLADRQIRHLQGVQGIEMVVPPGKTEVDFAVRVPTWLEMNRTSRTVVMAVGEVKDEEGKVHKVSYSSGATNDQIIMLTAPCPLSVRTARRSILAEAGQTTRLPVQVARGVLDPAPVKLELILPRHFQGVACQAEPIAADADAGEIEIRFDQSISQFNAPATIRATILAGQDPVIAETQIEFVNPTVNAP